MIRISLKRAAVVATMASASVALLGGGTPASATATPIPHPGQTFTLAGSDTTEEFMGRWLNQGNGSGQANGDYNVPARPTTPFNVPADANCAARTYGAAPVGAGQTLAPNGSSAGIQALVNDPNCIDAARSSRGPSSSDPSGQGLKFTAYGIEALQWATFSPFAPSSLTLTQIRGIFSCSITNWNEVGGIDAPIRPHIPQPNSGTGPFFISQVLGGASNVGSCVKQVIQEHSGRDSNLTGADYPFAIFPYSASQWIYQSINSANPSIDLRNGARLGSIAGACGVSAPTQALTYNGTARRWLPNAALINEANAQQALATPGNGCGVRFLWNVIRPANPGAAVAEQYVGLGSKLCSPTGGAGADLAALGISSIPNVNGSVCRQVIKP